jgi:type I restriction enzyme S subunit
MSKWTKVKLNDICNFSKGEQLNKLDLEKIGEYPCINGGIEPSGYTNKWNTESNTITISEGGNSCGYVNYLRTKFWSGGHCYTLLDIDNKTDKLFLYYALKGRESFIMRLRVGSGLPNIQQKSLKEFEFEKPDSTTEQRKIAQILSTTDLVIEKTQAAIAKYKAIKQGMLHDLFTRGIDITTGKLRPKQKDAPELFNESELGWIPKEWDENILKEIVDSLSPVTYGIVQPGSFDSNGILLIRGQDYISGWATEPEFFRVSENLHKQFIRSKTLNGDILICIVGATYGAVSVVPDWIKEANITQTTARIRCDKSTFSPSFLEYYLKSQFGRFFIEKYVKGSAQPGLNLGDLDKFIIRFPKLLEEQMEIGKRMQSIDNKIISEQAYLQKLQQIKSGLMADLLSGKKLVTVTEELKTQVN